MLKELKQRGMKIAVVSNKPDEAVKILCKEYFGEYVDVAIGATENMARKPAPDALLKAMDELGVTKEEVMYIGDSDVDIATSKNAGVRFVAVTWGFRGREFLMEHGAKELIALPMELLYLI